MLVAGLSLLGCSGEPKDTHPDQWVSKRRAIFKELTRTLEPISLAASGREPYRQPEVLALALQLEQTSTRPWPLFTPDSNYPPTRARPEVWSDAPAFKSAQEDYLEKVQQLKLAARTGDVDKTKVAVDAVAASCKSCHRKFRNE